MARHVLAVLVTVTLAGCGISSELASRHGERVRSLAVTAKTIADAWASHQVSTPYARVALRQAYQQLEQERSALTSDPSQRLDGGTEATVAAADRVETAVATMLAGVQRGDAPAVRRAAGDLPTSVFASPGAP